MVLLKHLKPEVVDIVRKLIIEDDRLEMYRDIYKTELGRSLDAETAESSSIRSFITFFNKMPTGKEEGKFVAMEFTGPTVKIILMTLADNKCDLKIETYEIPEKYMKGKSKKLFHFLAKCLSDFIKKMKVVMCRIPLGITFGFPIEQISLQDCKLLRWVKGFQCNDLVGENIFPRLKDAFREYPNLKNIYIIGILNETVSVMLASTVHSSNCKIAMTAGHSVNCCYMEKISRIGKYEAKTYGEKFMCINLETADFGKDGCIDAYKTDFDIKLDENSETPGKLINEKMTSLTYFGEIARLALIQCIESQTILDGQITNEISQKDALKYNHMMEIESDPEDDHTKCRKVLEEFGYKSVSDEDCTQIQFVCRCVSRRAANLMAAQLAALIHRINEPLVGIVLDGELIRNYPQYEWYLLRKLNQIKKSGLEVEIFKLDEDGLVKGAGVLASVFGNEIMDRDEKLRRLPGLPVNRCHFSKTGKCLNPNCGAKYPCDKSNVNPMQNPMIPECQDLEVNCFDQSERTKGNPCFGYENL